MTLCEMGYCDESAHEILSNWDCHWARHRRRKGSIVENEGKEKGVGEGTRWERNFDIFKGTILTLSGYKSPTGAVGLAAADNEISSLIQHAKLIIVIQQAAVPDIKSHKVQ